jgi:hypothetical protein
MSAWLIYGKIVKAVPLPDGKGGKKIQSHNQLFEH